MKKILRIIANVLIWVFVVFSALVTIMAFTTQNNKDNLPNIFGKSLVTVQSDSMKPMFVKGDLIIVQSLSSQEKSELKEDDVITYRTDLNNDGIKAEFNSHKIISVRSENGYTYYNTKGDNNEIADQVEVRYDEIVGKYTGTVLKGFGNVLDFFRQPTSFLICIVIPLILFFLYELYRFIAVIVANKGKKLSEDEENELKKKWEAEFLAKQKAAEDSIVENDSQEQK